MFIEILGLLPEYVVLFCSIAVPVVDWDADQIRTLLSVRAMLRKSFADKIFYSAVPDFRITCSTRHDLFRREEF